MTRGMDTANQLILQIYRAAREQAVDEFQDFVLALVRAVIPFTSSRWATAEIVEKMARTRVVHLHNEIDNIVLDWESISHQDTFKDKMLAHPGRALGSCASVAFKGKEFAEVRDYTQRYRHAVTLGIMLPATLPNHWEALSLWRDTENQFVEREGRLLELLMPHLNEALIQNRWHGLQHTAISSAGMADGGATAIVRCDGSLLYVSDACLHLLRQEWPDWSGHKLPVSLLDALGRGNGFAGTAISVSVTHAGEVVFLRASRVDPLRCLSKREYAVAQLFGQGLSYKEIAQQLNIAPATVRVFLQRIYDKLGIGDKAELAQLIGHGLRSS